MASAPPSEDHVDKMYPQAPVMPTNPNFQSMMPMQMPMPMQAIPTTTTIIHEKPSVHVTTTNVLPLGNRSVRMNCPFCHHDIKTRTSTTASTRANLWCLLMFCFCCWPCSCVPCCMSSCRDTSHECPKCDRFLGKYYV